jgi:hypothetical protein
VCTFGSYLQIQTLSTPRIGRQEVSDEGNNGSRSRMDSDHNCAHPISEQSYCICDKLHAGPTTTTTRECPVFQVQRYKPYSRPPLHWPQVLKTEGKWTRFSDLCSLCSGESDEEEWRRRATKWVFKLYFAPSSWGRRFTTSYDLAASTLGKKVLLLIPSL